MPGGLDYAMFDFGVNSGPSRAIKFVQEIVGARVDGRLGPQTMGAIQLSSAGPLVTALCDKRLVWLRGLRRWPTFGKGWSRRVKAVQADALSMTRTAPSEPKPVTPPWWGIILAFIQNWRRK